MHINRLPIIGKIATNFDNHIGAQDLKSATTKLFRLSPKNFSISGHTKATDKLLRHSPALITINHPYNTEPLLLTLALPPRQDIFLIIHDAYLTVGPNFNRHLIPIYPKQSIIDQSKKLTIIIGRNIHFGRVYSNQDAHQKNIDSIKLAAEKINQGGIVIHCPEGVLGKNWFPGIGHLISQLNPQTKAHYLSTNIQGTSYFDLFHHVPGMNYLLPKLKLTFPPPQPISQILKQTTNPKQITRLLQQQYQQTFYSPRSSAE